jgi:hypothetical protein
MSQVMLVEDTYNAEQKISSPRDNLKHVDGDDVSQDGNNIENDYLSDAASILAIRAQQQEQQMLLTPAQWNAGVEEASENRRAEVCCPIFFFFSRRSLRCEQS